MKKKFLIFSLALVSLLTVLVNPNVVNAAGEATKGDYVGNLTCGGTEKKENGEVIAITFHENLPKFTNTLYDILKIATPVIIIITGMLDVLKAVSAQKEDDMKKATSKFVNRLLAGAVVFLVFVITETVINLAIPDDIGNGWNCVECFLTDYTVCDSVEE